jgi:hypothetical protein
VCGTPFVQSECEIVTAVTVVKQELKYRTVSVNTVWLLTFCLSINNIPVLCKYGLYCVMNDNDDHDHDHDDDDDDSGGGGGDDLRETGCETVD